METISDTILFFEHESVDYDKISFLKDQESRDLFKKSLQDIWDNRNEYGVNSIFEGSALKQNQQQFFTFYDKSIKAKNYVGVIRFNDINIQILPKIFEIINDKSCKDQKSIKAINFHLLWWLSECDDELSVLKSNSSWDSISFKFLDILICIYANITKNDIIFNKHQAYVELEENIGTVRGRIDFNKYSVNLVSGKPHILPCIYDSLEIDNPYNRILKFTSKFLIHKTDNDEIKKILQDIVFILDEVEDVSVTIADCYKVKLSPLNLNMRKIMDFCKMFLSGKTINSSNEELEIYAFLFPMEVLFEKFVRNFIKSNFFLTNQISNIYYQNNGDTEYLAKENHAKKENAFLLKPDIYIKRKDKKEIIIDPKYKKIYNREESSKYSDMEQEELYRPKSGASAHDIRQMLGYAVRYNVNQISLVYPDKLDTTDNLFDSNYEINDILGNKNEIINIGFYRIPIITGFGKFDSETIELEEIFDDQKKILKKILEGIIFK